MKGGKNFGGGHPGGRTPNCLFFLFVSPSFGWRAAALAPRRRAPKIGRAAARRRAPSWSVQIWGTRKWGGGVIREFNYPNFGGLSDFQLQKPGFIYEIAYTMLYLS